MGLGWDGEPGRATIEREAAMTAAEWERFKEWQETGFADLGITIGPRWRREPLATVLNPKPRNRSIQATRWQLMSRREKIHEICAIGLVAVVLAVIIFGVVLLTTKGGRAWLGA